MTTTVRCEGTGEFSLHPISLHPSSKVCLQFAVILMNLHICFLSAEDALKQKSVGEFENRSLNLRPFEPMGILLLLLFVFTSSVCLFSPSSSCPGYIHVHGAFSPLNILAFWMTEVREDVAAQLLPYPASSWGPACQGDLRIDTLPSHLTGAQRKRRNICFPFWVAFQEWLCCGTTCLLTRKCFGISQRAV